MLSASSGNLIIQSLQEDVHKSPLRIASMSDDASKTAVHFGLMTVSYYTFCSLMLLYNASWITTFSF